jgi:hypothetical protein
MRILGMLLLSASLAGCQTAGQPTASGSPETTIAGARPEQVKPLLVNAAMNRGLKLKTDTAYSITFERPWGGSLASQALADAMVGVTVERLTFSVAETPDGGTRVVVDRYSVKQRYGREEASPANNGLGAENLQAMLDQMAPSLSPPPAISTPAAPKRKPGT